MIYRKLGKTCESVSAIGMGGAHIAAMPDDKEAVRLIRKAVDSGLTFMDNSWDYGGGRGETIMGKALEGGYRQKVFLMTKIDGRTKESAASQINQSLKRLKVGHVDLMQFHEVIRMEDADRIFAKDGAIHAMLEAKKAGKLRYIGFTGHKDPLVHLRTLEVAALRGFGFDTVQMPLNVMDAHFRSFEKKVLPLLTEQGIGVLGMKPLANGHILQSQTVSAMECLHYALNLPVSTVITGIDSEEVLAQALEAARTFMPLAENEIEAILAKTIKRSKTGEFEPFKTGVAYDATAANPSWLG